jgi:uncharacterized lipoprotein
MEIIAPHHLKLYSLPVSFAEDVLMKFENVDRERNINVSAQLELIKSSRIDRQREKSQLVLNRSNSRSLGRAFDSTKF